MVDEAQEVGGLGTRECENALVVVADGGDTAVRCELSQQRKLHGARVLEFVEDYRLVPPAPAARMWVAAPLQHRHDVAPAPAFNHPFLPARARQRGSTADWQLQAKKTRRKAFARLLVAN